MARPVDLSGQIALVTGASAGLGRRFAHVLAAAGAGVVVTGRREALLEDLVREIADAGGKAWPLPLDMTDAAGIGPAVDRAEAAAGGTIRILVNNAGIPDAQRAHKLPLELIDRVLDTNVRGPFVLSCEIARRLMAAELPGRIVNLSSISSFQYDGSGAALYSISKAAVNRMTETLAVEWARRHINVNAIAPGSFESEMTNGMIDRVGAFHEKLPRKRLGRPDQLDSTLLYLVDPDSDCVTGTIVKVDDGQKAR
jgi:NAD(P)-dependent dehydrogenase (short-subunit alcohol dehydrogenase family)